MSAANDIEELQCDLRLIDGKPRKVDGDFSLLTQPTLPPTPPLDILPPPPPPLPPAPPHPPAFDVEKSKFFKMIAERNTPAAERPEDIRKLLKNRRDSFRRELQWLLFHSPLPSLIQEGPQCGLVALWMAGALLKPEDAVSLDTIVHVARERGYTAQGEMFSAASMVHLAREVFRCRADLLDDGMAVNRGKILRHLTSGRPVLVPYDEDCNHEPCSRGGHRAHWAALSGVLLGLRHSSTISDYQEDPDVLGLFHPHPGSPCPPDQEVEDVFLLAKQGKSQRSQLWNYEQVCSSNLQLLNLDPKRASDGKTYVLPEGGVKAGLCGKIVLLHPGTA
ncbi:actin maturation protease [Ambystoma mexicanum]|uniref:actin maturation protease n=1 Tax=Ambystoma mexicanum TaxID=8296 RepID=UPI0037E8AC50